MFIGEAGEAKKVLFIYIKLYFNFQKLNNLEMFSIMPRKSEVFFLMFWQNKQINYFVTDFDRNANEQAINEENPNDFENPNDQMVVNGSNETTENQGMS